MRLKFRLSNGKKTFFQWDVNQKIILENPICTQVHFENKDISDKAYVKEVYKDNEGRSVVDIPDIFLQYTPGFLFYGYVISEDGKERFTEERGDVSVIRRAKPSDYVFTPEDQKTLEEVFDDAVKYVPEKKTDEEKANARENIEAEFEGNKVNAIGDDADDEHYPSTKAVKEYVRNSAVQADWEQNGDTKAGYIKGRTHYEYDKEHIATRTFTATGAHTVQYICTNDDMSLMRDIYNISNGNKYLITTINGKILISNVSFDRGWIYIRGGFSSKKYFSAEDGEVWDATVAGNVKLVEGDVYKVGFYSGDGVKTLDEVYLSDYVFTQANAPIVYGEGNGSAIQGRETTATGLYSHAEGDKSLASGFASHAEGEGTIASATASHAEGKMTTASGQYSHAEGEGTIADCYLTTVAGRCNIAQDCKYGIYKSYKKNARLSYNPNICYYSDKYTFDWDSGIFELVSPSSTYSPSNVPVGKYVIFKNTKGDEMSRIFSTMSSSGGWVSADAITFLSRKGDADIYDGKYIQVIGNGVYGVYDSYLSNAYTLDWDGNAWFSGDVYVGSTSGTNKDDGSKKLATVDYVEQGMQEIQNHMPHLYMVHVWNEIDDNGESTYTSDAHVIQIMVDVFPALVNQTASINCLFAESEDDGSPVNKAMLLPCVNISNPESIIPTPNTTFPIFAEFSANVSGKIVTVRMESEIAFDENSEPDVPVDVITVTKKTVLPTPSTAVVGQVIKVKSIDSDGKILETEAVDLSSTSVNITYNEETGNLQIGG